MHLTNHDRTTVRSSSIVRPKNAEKDPRFGVLTRLSKGDDADALQDSRRPKTSSFGKVMVRARG